MTLETLGERHVATQGFEHMLPRAGRIGIADATSFSGGEGANDVDDETIGGPVAAADDVAGARGGDGDFVLDIFPARKKIR